MPSVQASGVIPPKTTSLGLCPCFSDAAYVFLMSGSFRDAFFGAYLPSEMLMMAVLDPQPGPEFTLLLGPSRLLLTFL